MKKLLLSFLMAGGLLSLNAQTDLIISEYVEGWSNNKALEIYNPTANEINLKNYRVTRYSNGSDVPPANTQWTAALPDFVLKPYKSYVIVLDKRDPNGEGQEAPVWNQLAQRADVFLCPVYNTSKAMYFNGDDAVTIEKTDGTLVDLFARWGSPRPAEATIGGSTQTAQCWTNISPYFTGQGVGITADHTMIKKSSVKSGVTVNPSVWNPLQDWDTLPVNTFSQLGWHKCDAAPANATPVFTKTEYKYGIPSTATNGTEVASIKANDADAVRYYIEYGNFVYINEGDKDIRVEPFALNRETGVLSLADAKGLVKEVKDTFNLKVVATDGYSQTEEVLVQVILDWEVGVKSLVVKPSMNLYPNPTSNNVFTVEANKEIKSIVVSNIIGQEVFFLNNVNKSQSKVVLNSADKGIYLVQLVLSDASIITQKLVIK